MSNARGGFGGRGGGGRGGGGGGPGGLLLNPQVIGIFTNLFLQLPFSRRAEAEADLIGLKLMGLAGYDPQVGAPSHQLEESVQTVSTAGYIQQISVTYTPRSSCML